MCAPSDEDEILDFERLVLATLFYRCNLEGISVTWENIRSVTALPDDDGTVVTVLLDDDGGLNSVGWLNIQEMTSFIESYNLLSYEGAPHININGLNVHPETLVRLQRLENICRNNPESRSALIQYNDEETEAVIVTLPNESIEIPLR